MATMPISGKTLQTSSTLEQNGLETWYVALGMCVLPGLHKWWIWLDLDLFFTTKPNLIPYIGKILKCLFFYNCFKRKYLPKLLNLLRHWFYTNTKGQSVWPFTHILRKTIEGYLESVPSLTFNTIKTKLIMHAFHSSIYLQSKWMLYFSHAAMV